MTKKIRGGWSRKLGARMGGSLLVLGLTLCATTLSATPIPFKKGVVEIHADKSLHEFLPDFFHDQGLEVVMSPQVAARSGTLNGDFKGGYAQVWRKLADSNGLFGYWDGSAVYVYLNTERQTDYTSVPLPVEQQFLAAMASVNWSDAASGDIWRLEPSTGLVMITGSRRFIEQVKQMAQTIAGLGQNPSLRFKMYPLKYAWASDTTITIGNRQVNVPGVASVLRQLVGVAGGDQFGGAHERLISARQPGLRGQGLAGMGQQPPPPLGNYTVPAQNNDDNETALSNSASSQSAQQNTLQAVNGQGDSRIVADSFRNAIIVRDTADRMPMYDELIRQLDVAPQMVEIEATIIDVNKQKARSLGVNWFYRNKGITGGFTSNGPNNVPIADDAKKALAAALLGGKNGSALAALASLFGGGGQIGAILGDPAHFVANVDALEADGVTHVVTHPQVITMNDAEAVIQSNQTVYVPVSGAYNSDLYNVVAGTTLRVTPHLVEDNGRLHIRMAVQIDDGNITYTTADSQGVAYPIVSNNAVNTQAVIEDGQGLLLGGLIQDSGSNATQKIPVLGNIPVLGYLFKTVQKQRAHIERLFLITPRLIALNQVTGQETPSSSKVTIESQQQIDERDAKKTGWWRFDNPAPAPASQPQPSIAPIPPQPPVPAANTAAPRIH
ncbi:type III secretion system outer membrane ring subunit SctC [Dyella choica]|uniref:Type 3 secretion system secretin n=1 Tax=Dyella choica TaxID=1927959 RepID=A0A432MA36_9GAMM|nr:type III secretion system outer membrane ring subunit SctC [Dyella choica]RUL79059.1 EscC/YscC/HrcC family type III secretion system outer membrane ring protein [Dyella choica]